LTHVLLRRLYLIAGLALLVWLILSIGPRQIGGMAKRLGWGIVPVFVLYAGHQLVRARALQLSVVPRGALSYRAALFVRLSGEGAQVLTTGGAVVGEPFKAWLLTQQGLSGANGIAATLTEFLVYKFVSAVVLTVALAYLRLHVDLPAALEIAARVFLWVGPLFLIVSAMAIARRFYLIGWGVERVAHIPVVRRRWPLDPARVRAMEDVLFENFREQPRLFARLLTLAAVAHVLLVFELWVVLVRLDLPSPLFNAWLIDAATKPMGGVFFFVPGQVGTNEAILAAVFTALGLPGAVGVVVSLTRRLRSLAVASVGLAALWGLGRRG
jgi:uncharacterized membrane protein YbhN (UPF0104 family)